MIKKIQYTSDLDVLKKGQVYSAKSVITRSMRKEIPSLLSKYNKVTKSNLLMSDVEKQMMSIVFHVDTDFKEGKTIVEEGYGGRKTNVYIPSEQWATIIMSNIPEIVVGGRYNIVSLLATTARVCFVGATNQMYASRSHNSIKIMKRAANLRFTFNKIELI